MPTQAPEIDGVTLINDFEGAEPKPGEIRRLRITEAHDYDLVGTLLPGEDGTGSAVAPFPLVQIAPIPNPKSPPPFYEVPDLPQRESPGRIPSSLSAASAAASSIWATGPPGST